MSDQNRDQFRVERWKSLGYFSLKATTSSPTLKETLFLQTCLLKLKCWYILYQWSEESRNECPKTTLDTPPLKEFKLFLCKSFPPFPLLISHPDKNGIPIKPAC